MILLDLTHTSHTGARTGVQRVAQTLWRELGPEARPICRDPYAQSWRPLAAWELAALASEGGGRDRGVRWPWSARLRGRLRRGPEVAPGTADRAAGFLVPEIFSPAVAAALPALFAAVPGPKAALFFDAAPLLVPELTPPRTVARYPAYLQELLLFDGVAAISEDARDRLLAYWRWLGALRTPPVVAIPLGIEAPKVAPSPPSGRPLGMPVVLAVGSIEGRKNHLALLEACEALWAQGRRFELRLIGLARPETAGAALRRLRELQAAGRPVRHEGFAADAALESAYADCAFTVYPSLLEGFGLPVGESLRRGKPCVCSARGAVGESARGGGCLALEAVDTASLAGAIGQLLSDPAALAGLSAAARARTFKTGADYAREIHDWMAGLKSGFASSG